MKRSIALGVFDGLHLAHQAVLRAAAAYQAQGFRPAVPLFTPHPMALTTGTPPARLLLDGERDEMLGAMGLDLLPMPFGEIMGLSPEDFVDQVLLEKYQAGALSCGYHYRFGSAAAGDAVRLRKLCDARGIMLSVVPQMDYQDEPISSTRIRAALEQGRIGDANAMLGRPFGYRLRVERGERMGRVLGAPTINQHFPPDFAVPRFGVYASRAYVEGAWRASVTNIGRKPTFGLNELRSETHILAYDGDLYGQEIDVRLHSFLRPERVFRSMEELIKQIGVDKASSGKNHEK
ncbi:MAG: riboflavin biosynthesis protein RibF [Oscillospiraceae bacterium]|nr:riboflavin biosynthesis protein RibF [Oscillospiraceae bacterium]